jgi:hypothetical protein
MKVLNKSSEILQSGIHVCSKNLFSTNQDISNEFFADILAKSFGLINYNIIFYSI